MAIFLLFAVRVIRTYHERNSLTTMFTGLSYTPRASPRSRRMTLKMHKSTAAKEKVLERLIGDDYVMFRSHASSHQLVFI